MTGTQNRTDAKSLSRMVKGWAGAVLLAASGLSAHAQDIDAERQFRQPPEVMRRYADVPIAMTSPALVPGREALTSQVEMQLFLWDIARRSPHARVVSMGLSQEGRDLPLVFLTKEGLSDPAAIRALGRPVIWFIGQQHGNEPAGGEAMLALTAALAEGVLKPLLDTLTVIIVPRANPDGAAANRRTSANGFDLNRDHLLLTLPETRALHRAMAQAPADLVIDFHEFSVATRWLEKFDALQAVDAMLLHATHPAAPKALTQLAEGVLRPAMETALKAKGLSLFWYYTTGYDTRDKTVSMGGNAPGIARNLFGLSGAVSFLVETRGLGVALQGYQRRVATHYVLAQAALEAVAADPAVLLAAVKAGRAAIAVPDTNLIVQHRIATVKLTAPLIDPRTGEDKPTEVDFRDSRQATITVTRPRPAGYVLMPEAASAIVALRLKGAATCALPAGTTLDVEAFIVEGGAAAASRAQRENINPDAALKVTLAPRRIVAPEGAVFVSMGQSLGEMIAASLEPDTPGSHVGVGVAPVLPSGEASVYRVMRGAQTAQSGCKS